VGFIPPGKSIYPHNQAKSGKPAVGRFDPHNLTVIATLILYLLLATGSVFTRLPRVDEALFASPAVNLVSQGYMGTTVIETIGTRWQGLDRHTYWTVPLHFLAQAGWYELFGFSLYSMRALSEVWGLVALAGLYLIARVLSANRDAAALATALIAVDSSFIPIASSGRMDMMNAALGMSGLAAYLCLRQNHLRAAVLSAHSLVCASGLTHPNGILYLASLVSLMVYFDRRRLSLRDWTSAALPYALGVSAWGLYIRQDPSLFFALFTANMQNGTRLSYLKAPWAGLWTEVVDRYLAHFGLARESNGLSRLKLLIPLAQAVGVAGLLSSRHMRSRPGCRAVLLVSAVHFGLLALYDGQKLPYYLVHTVPLLDMVLAIWIASSWSSQSIRRPLLALLLTALFGVQILTSVQRISHNPYRTSYLPAVAFLKKNAGDKELIMGSAALDFEMGFNRNVLDDPRLGYYSGKTPQFIVVGDTDFGEYFRDFELQEPAVYTFIVSRLCNDYRPVYDHAGQKIYVRRSVVSPGLGR